MRRGTEFVNRETRKPTTNLNQMRGRSPCVLHEPLLDTIENLQWHGRRHTFEIVGSALYLKASTRKNLDFFCPPPPRADFRPTVSRFLRNARYAPATPDVSLPCSERTQILRLRASGYRTRRRGPPVAPEIRRDESPRFSAQGGCPRGQSPCLLPKRLVLVTISAVLVVLTRTSVFPFVLYVRHAVGMQNDVAGSCQFTRKRRHSTASANTCDAPRYRRQAASLAMFIAAMRRTSSRIPRRYSPHSRPHFASKDGRN